MKTVKTDIYKEIKKNSSITKLALIMAGLSMAFSIYFVSLSYSKNSKFIYGISEDGNLFPLERLEKNKLDAVLKKSHIELFLTKFYQYDQFNYENQIEAALWLIDTQSGESLYNFYKSQGHFNTVIQKSTSQSISSLEINLNDLEFEALIVLDINAPNQIEKNSYRLLVKGTLVEVAQNYPKNPNGFLIINYKEISKTKIEE